MLGRGLAGAARGFALLLLVWSGAAGAADLVFPALTGRVVDEAAILSPATRGQLDAMLAADEKASGRQLVVVTLKSLEGDTIEDFGYRLGRAWGIGQKGKDNGVLLIVAPKERKVRIEVGYGLEGTLTDAASREIIESEILPQFRKGDFDAGVLGGAGAILRLLGSPAAPAGSASDGGATAFPADFPAPVPSSDLSGINIDVVMAIFVLIAVIGFAMPFLLPLLWGRGYRGGVHVRGLNWGSGGSSDDSSSSSSDDDDFSGGGGSFGGGGASGSW